MERPSPDNAPQRPASVFDRHKDRRKPSQLNRNETENKNTKVALLHADMSIIYHTHVITITLNENIIIYKNQIYGRGRGGIFFNT